MKRKIIYALMALVISFGMWLYVITVENPEWENTFYNIPVVLTNETALESRGLMITSENVPTVTLRLSGNRSDLNKLNSGNITLVADLSKIYETGKQQLSYTIIYPGDVPSNSFEVLNQNPNRINLSIAEKGFKDVEVKIVYKGAVPGGFIADKDNPILDYPKITVTGPTEVIEKINCAEIEVDLKDQNEDISQSYSYVLKDKDGKELEAKDVKWITTNVDSVNLFLKIQRFKEIPLLVNKIYGGGATASNTVVDIYPKTIQISGSEKLLNELDELILDTIDLSMLDKNTKLTFPIKLPAGVTTITGETEAEVTIVFNDLAVKELQVSYIQAWNVPKGMQVNIITQVLNVKVRGPIEQIEELTEENLTVRVDFSEAELGTATFKAVIRVDAGFDRVGVMGTYSVSVTLEEETIEVADEDDL